MDNLENELAKTRRELRNWRYLAAVSVMLATIMVVLAAVPFAMS